MEQNTTFKLNPKRKMTLTRKLFIISFITLPILHFIVFYIYPNFNAFLMGFQKHEGVKVVWTLAFCQYIPKATEWFGRTSKIYTKHTFDFWYKYAYVSRKHFGFVLSL